MVPTLDDLFTLVYNKQDEPCGLKRNSDEVLRLAKSTPTEELIAVLEKNDDLERLLGALHLIPYGVPKDPEIRLRLEHVLLDCMDDDRVHTWSWGEASYQYKTFAVSVLATEAAVRVMEHKFCFHRQHAWNRQVPEEMGHALTLLLDRALSGSAGSQPTRAVISAFRRLCYNDSNKEEVARRLADCFRVIACDRAKVATLRAQAIRELEKVISTNPLGQKAYFEAAQKKITEHLLSALNDTTEDFQFRKQVRATLTRLAPERIEALQIDGRLDTVPLPPAKALLNAWGMPSDDKARAAAALMTERTVVDGFTSKQPDRILAAACLAPLLGKRTDWRVLATCLLQAVQHSGTIEHCDPRGRTVPIHISPIAAERLLKLLSPHIRQNNEDALQLFFAGLDLLLERTPNYRRAGMEPIHRYLREVRWNKGPLQDKLQEHLTACAHNPNRPHQARFAALLADRRPETDAYAWALLHSPETPLTLKVLIGSQIHQWCPDQLSVWVDKSCEKSWTLLPNAPVEMPISEPGRKVPMPWLITSLKTSEHDAITFSTIRSLGARFNRRRETPDLNVLRKGLMPWVDPALTTTLRRVLDASTQNDPPYWSAAVCLALIGDLDDEERLVQFAVYHGAWTCLDPLSDAFLETSLLEHLILRPLQHSAPHHMIEPYLLAGFGPEHTHRLMAKIFVGLGQQARRDGFVHSARWACRLARQLDPLNLAARRGERF